jgi:hypothetical protein
MSRVSLVGSSTSYSRVFLPPLAHLGPVYPQVGFSLQYLFPELSVPSRIIFMRLRLCKSTGYRVNDLPRALCFTYQKLYSVWFGVESSEPEPHPETGYIKKIMFRLRHPFFSLCHFHVNSQYRYVILLDFVIKFFFSIF